MKKKIIDLFWKCKAWYITTFACILSVINLFLQSKILQVGTMTVLLIGVIKMILDINHSLDEAYEKIHNSLKREMIWMDLPSNIDDAIVEMDLPEETKTEIRDVIWDEVKKVMYTVEGLRNDNQVQK